MQTATTPLIHFLGLPGAGKTSQAISLSQQLAYTFISSGDVVRETLNTDSQYAHILARCRKGNLPPFRVITKLLLDKICQTEHRGIIIDGFPRTIAQGKCFEQSLARLPIEPILVIYLQGLTRKELVERATQRVVCPCCLTIYRIKDNHYPICATCGRVTVKRSDGSREEVMKRIKIQSRYIGPLRNHFYEKGILVEIDASKPQDVIHEQLIRYLKSGFVGGPT